MNAIGTQLRDPINPGLTRWRSMAVFILINGRRRGIREESRIVSNKHHIFSLSLEMSRLARDGTAEPVSRDQILRRERGEGNIKFPCSADHVQDWQPYPVDPCSCCTMLCDHTTTTTVLCLVPVLRNMTFFMLYDIYL